MPARRSLRIDSFPESAFRHLEADAVACIDVILSGTTLATAVAQGRRVLLVESAEEARRVAGLDGACAAGTREEVPIVGLELPDSPTALLREPPERALVLCSPPGTQLILNAASAPLVLVASFRNLSATAERLAACHRVALLGAGCREEFSCEDQMAAAWIASRLARAGFEPEDRRTAALMQRWEGIEPALAAWGNAAEALRRTGRIEDLDFVLAHVDDLRAACVYRDGEVVSEGEALSAGLVLAAPLAAPRHAGRVS